MTPGPASIPVTERLHGDLPVADATTAADHVAADDVLLVSGFGSVGDPKRVPEALADAARSLSLTVISGGSVGPPIDETLIEAGAVARRYPFQATTAAREAINDRRVAFSDRHVGGLGDDVRFGRLGDGGTALVEAVAVGPDWLVPSTSIGQTPAFVEAADQVIVELNHAQPIGLQGFHDSYRQDPPPDRRPIPLEKPDDRIGTPWISFDPAKLVAVVETDRRDVPYEFRDPTDADQRIAGHVREWLLAERDRSPALGDAMLLQYGVGSLGNALMGALDDIDTENQSIGYFGEVIQDGLLDALASETLSFASGTSLAVSRAGQERLFAAIDEFAADVVLRPAAISNHPALLDRFGVIAVNSAVEVDVFGNVNSTHLDGRHLLQGIGGAGEFNRHALVSVCAFPSTARDGDVSRLVPRTRHVDHTEHDVDVFVTEQGIADVRACAPLERAERLVENCAHPAYKPRLRSYVSQARDRTGHIPLDETVGRSW